MSEASLPRHRLLALAWLAAMLALAFHQWQFGQKPSFATDVTQLLPQRADANLTQATAGLVATASPQ